MTLEDQLLKLKKECEALKKQIAALEKSKDIWMRSDMQARDYAIKLERRISEMEEQS